jgi:simple sugar transport system substrate-binding protein
MKKFLVMIAALGLVLGLAACGNGSNNNGDDAVITVGFSQVGAESDWRTANTKSMKETFTKANGYKLIFNDAQQKQENQITAIRNFILQKVDYIILAPLSETGWDTVLQEAKDAGIPVIIVDRMIDVSDNTLFTCWVGSDFRREGDAAVEWMQKTVSGDSINIVHLQGTMGSSAQIGRTRAIEDGVTANVNWNLIAQQSGEFTQAKGQEVMTSILKQGQKIDVVYAENDNMAFGVIDAIEAEGLTVGVDGDIVLISFDATRAGLLKTLEGKINFNVECNPLHGPRVAAIIQQLEAGETPEKLVCVEEEVFDAKIITQEMLDKRTY